MNSFPSLKALVAILTLLISSQLFAEEQKELSTIEVNALNAKVVNALASPKEKKRDYLVFVSGGVSNFREDIGTTVGDGASFRFALGVQYNKWFGLEVYAETAPPLGPTALLEDLEQNIDQNILGFSASTKGNKYAGLLGKFSFDVNNQFTLVSKVGVARFEAHQVSANLKLENEADNTLFSYHNLNGGAKGYTPVVSFGYETPFPFGESKKISGEVSLTQMFDDKVKNLSLNATLKYTF